MHFFPLALQPIVGVYFTALYRALASSRKSLFDHTKRRATVGGTALNEWSVRRRDLYLTTHNTQTENIYAPGGIYFIKYYIYSFPLFLHYCYI
jgi:hypothetical protein